MKTRCILPSTLDELQAELEKQHISIQKFFLDENITPQKRNDILLSALGTQDNVDFFVDTVYEDIITPLLKQKAAKELAREKIKQNIVDDMVLNRIRRIRGRLSPTYEEMYLDKLVQEDMKMALTSDQSEALVEAQASVDSALEDLNIAIESSGKFGGRSFLDIYKDSDVQELEKDDVLFAKKQALGLAIVKYNKTYSDIAQALLDKQAGAVAKKIVGSSRTALLSGDLSFGRNISNMLFVSPKTFGKSWVKGFARTMQDIWYGNKKDEYGYTKRDYALAEIYSHPNVVSGRLKQLGVNIGITEEPFLNSGIMQIFEGAEAVSRGEKTIGKSEVTQKVAKTVAMALRPVTRLYSASESGFDMAVDYARFTYANMMIDLFGAKSKQDIKRLKDNGIGDLIMEQTGRWNGLKGGKDVVDQLSFWLTAMRWTASRISTAKNIIYAPVAVADITKQAVTKVSTGKAKGIETIDTSYWNKRNVDKGRSAVGIVVGMGVMSAIISAALDEDSDEDFWEKFLNHLFSTKDYGKIVFGKTRFDMTFGVAPVITMVAKTGQLAWTREYGKDMWDPLATFIKNRRAPFVSLTIGALEHIRATVNEDYLPVDIFNQPETLGEFATSVLLPIYADNIVENFVRERDPEVSSLEASAAIFADIIGIGATTYSERASKAEILEKWGKASPLAQISTRTKLAQTLSKEEFIEAQKEMQERYLSEASLLMSRSDFNSMSREEKDKELMKLHKKIQNDISKRKLPDEGKKQKYGLK